MTYINSRAKIFGHLDRVLAWQQHHAAGPVTVEWDLTNRCPLHCPDCHFSHLRTAGPWSTSTPVEGYEPCGDLADFTVLERGLTEMAQAGLRSVVWSGGGEPLMHPEWPDAMALASSLGLRQGLYTSGITLSDGQAKRVAELCRWVVFSMDAPDEATYVASKGATKATWTKLIRNIKRMADQGQAAIGLSFLLHEGNWKDAERMLQVTRGLGATYATFRPMIETDPANPASCLADRRWITHALPLLRNLAKQPDVEVDAERFEEYRDWTGRDYDLCFGILLSTVVTPDGRIWDCCQRRGMPGSCLGDLTTETFAAIWHRRKPRADLAQCRVMCRLHLMNQTLAPMMAWRPHGEFL